MSDTASESESDWTSERESDYGLNEEEVERKKESRIQKEVENVEKWLMKADADDDRFNLTRKTRDPFIRDGKDFCQERASNVMSRYRKMKTYFPEVAPTLSKLHVKTALGNSGRRLDEARYRLARAWYGMEMRTAAANYHKAVSQFHLSCDTLADNIDKAFTKTGHQMPSRLSAKAIGIHSALDKASWG